MKPLFSSPISFTALTFLLLSGVPTHAAITLTDGFETDFGNWTDGGDAVYRTTSNPTTGSYAVALDTEADGTKLTLTVPLPLATGGATFVNIDFDGVWGSTGSGTRFFDVQYSSNNGLNWTQITRITSSQTPAAAGYTITTAAALTDEFLFRFFPKDDGVNASDWVFYLDNVVITSDATAVPEPSAALLGSLGLLALLRRRRQ